MTVFHLQILKVEIERGSKGLGFLVGGTDAEEGVFFEKGQKCLMNSKLSLFHG